jgi:subtilisin-like proprotein convertase family protein
MRKSVFSVLLCLVALAALWLFWPSTKPSKPVANSLSAPRAAAVAPAAEKSKSPSSGIVTRSAASTNREAFRLANTSKKLNELASAPHAILLENASVDTDAKLDLSIPKHLRAAGEPGAFIVQAHGPVNAAFRAALASAGAQIISYIPNNAYLVQLSGAGAGILSGNSQVQAVLPYEPYYKVQSSLLGLALDQKQLPGGQVLTLGLFASGADSTVQQIEKLGGNIIASDRSPFGPVVRVVPPSDWLALAQLPGVMRLEPATHRELANDLARVTMAISVDTVTNASWLNLTGSNVLVEVNDSGIDAGHPDFSVTGSASSPGNNPPTRVTGDSAGSLVDTVGHGTHVAGIIAGNGSQSLTLTNAPRGSVTNADFRGKAPAARLFSVGFKGKDTNIISDRYLQEAAALTNALISNNSWDDGVNEYDLSAASYDAAVRDALPAVTGPQPVLFVFAAGNSGAGDDNGGGGTADSIMSPGTAKNVITVGSLEQFRNITNEVVAEDGSTNTPWAGETSSSTAVAGYSSRGNVGIGTEGGFGRFKPDVVAPGTFVVSTRPSMWDQATYFSPTNISDVNSQRGVILSTNQLISASVFIPTNTVSLTISVQPNPNSPSPFPTNFPIYFSATDFNPGPGNNDFATSNNVLSIPPGGGTITSLTPILGSFVFCSVGNPTNQAVDFDFIIQVATTNVGNEKLVLSNLDNSIGPWYYYETGTSMAAPAVSGALALMQDFFVNKRNSNFPTNPSPALLKAMLINGARLTPGYTTFAVNTNINYEGWGLVNVPNSLPMGLTNTSSTNGTPMFFIDQSPTNILATGDKRTFNVNVPTAQARSQKLRLTLAWTDPPGNPAAGIKLVNNLDLVVTNLDNGKAYYGNNFVPGTSPVSAVVTNGVGVPDNINNVESVWLSAPLGTNYSVTVVGRNVAVNAVTTEQTNIVQDFALVISCGDSGNTNGINVTTSNAVPAIAPLVTFLTSFTNGINFNQLAGANAPWLSTSTVAFSAAVGFGTNASLQIGQTNQWHFFVVTNTTQFSNSAFVIFSSKTLSVARMGVFADQATNATTPEADLNLFVSSPQGTPSDPNAASLTNLNPVVISNCVFSLNGDQASLARGGTKFVVYSNAQPAQVYYVGVQCEDQTAGEFGFLAAFSQNPFSQNQNGNQIVSGLLLPTPIPDGNNTRPGVANVVALAVTPMNVGDVTVTNTITHQNYGDLIGAVTHENTGVVLNNHDGLGSGTFTRIYNDQGQPGTIGTDGPGSLKEFRGVEAAGPWLLTEVDDSQGGVGTITEFTLNIRPHVDLTHGSQQVVVPPGSFFFDYVDVPVGNTNMLITATNVTLPPQLALNPPVQMFLNYLVEPSASNFLAEADLNQISGGFPGNVISFGPPLLPGRYFIGLFNPSSFPQNVNLAVNLAFSASAITAVNFTPTNIVPLIDDAVTTNSIFVTNTDLIQSFSVGLRVDHPRISDLVFHLISPDGTRYLLMENRGGQTTNGCGLTVLVTNIFSGSASGGPAGATNVYDFHQTSGTIPVTWNFYVVPDQMDVYYGTNLIFTTGLVSGQGSTNITFGPGASTQLTVVMDATNHPPSTLWTYTLGSVRTNYEYLTFTEDTNLTITPIKYAVPPFTPLPPATVWTDNFDSYAAQAYVAGTRFGNWTVLMNQVAIATNPPANSLPNMLALGIGAVSNTLPTVPGRSYVLSYQIGSSASDTNTAVTNANWVLNTVTFTATQIGTPLVLDASGTGLAANTVLNRAFGTNTLFDDFSLSELSDNLYFQPEQKITGLNGTSARGLWTLEILDNRAGATNNANLLSWSLNFTFANTNFFAPAGTLANGVPLTNTVPAGSLAWYQVNVPLYVDFATNTLLFATNLPVNLWWSTNVPPTTTNATDVQLYGNTSGATAILGTNAAPAHIVPGGTYYLGVQNTNALAVGYALQVTFHFFATPPILPAQTNFTVAVTNLVTVTNTAIDLQTNVVLTYSLVNPPLGASISSNGIITWTAGPAGLAARFITIVSDNHVPPLTDTNAFTVFVAPIPSISKVTVTATNTVLSWNAPTNDLFEIRSTTNLVPPVTWTLLPNNSNPAIITSATGAFTYTDTNSTVPLKFYQLILLP